MPKKSKTNCNPPFSCFSCELPDCTKEISGLKMSKAEKKFMAIAKLPDDNVVIEKVRSKK